MLRFRKTLSCFILFMLAVVSFAGCGSVPGKPADPTMVPADDSAGFYGIDQSLVGGADVSGAKIYGFSYDVYDDSDEIILNFADADGSHASGVPVFETGYLGGVQRLCIRFAGVDQSEVFVDSDMTEGMGVLGAFMQAASDGSYSVMYLHLDGVADYQIVESESNLHIYLRRTDGSMHGGSCWHIQMDSPDAEIFYGSLASLGFSPSLCSDGQSVVLLSEGYASKDDAQNALAVCQGDLDKILPGQKTSIVEIAGGMLPVKPQNPSSVQQDASIILTDGSEQEVDIMIPDGRFLTWCPGRERYLFARVDRIPGVDSRADYVFEQLYIGGPDGETTLLPEMEFSYISIAAYSPDGRYLAFLDYMDVRRSLMVYDTQTQVLIDGEEIGFGYDTPTFVWQDSASTLYGITGNGESMGIHAVTMQDGVATETWNYDSMNMDDSRLAYYEGSLYFTKADEQTGSTAIYSLNVNDSTIMQVTDGTHFRLDPATGNLAILTRDNKANETTTTQLKVMNLPTLSTWIVAEKSSIIDMCWDASGERLICQSYLNSGVDEKFQLGLLVYDNTEHTLQSCMETVSGTLMASDADNEVLMSIVDTESIDTTYVTYRIPIQ